MRERIMITSLQKPPPPCSVYGPSFEISPQTTFERHKEKFHNVVAYTNFFVHTQASVWLAFSIIAVVMLVLP